MVLLAVGDIALGHTDGDVSRWAGRVATWMLGGVIYGLAAAGLYSQGSVVTRQFRLTPDLRQQ